MSEEEMKPLPVLGYSDQKTSNVDLVNENKILEELILRRITQLSMNDDAQFDQRSLSIARTKIQEGFMWMNRAIFQPQRLEKIDYVAVQDLLLSIGAAE